MEDFLIFVLLIAVVWLLYANRSRSLEWTSLQELAERLARMEERMRRLEQTPRAEPAATPQRPAEVHVPPRPVATPQAVAPSTPLQTGIFVPQAHIASAGTTTPQTQPLVAPKPLTPTSQPKPAPQPAPAVPPMNVPRSSEPPRSAPAFETAQRSLTLEERLGKNWLSKVGIVGVVIGVAGLLGKELRTIGPLGRSVAGMILALGILGGGLWLERRDKYRLFARALIGGGWALTFFVTFALYHVSAMKVLSSQAVDLVLMFVVAAAMVAHSLRYKSQVVTSLAFLLAFVTVGISEVTLFSLVAGVVLAASLAIIAARQYWFELTLAGIVGAYLNHFIWLHRVLPDGGQPGHAFPEFFASAGLLLAYWLIFRLVYVLRVPRDRGEQMISSGAAVANSVGLLSLLKFQSSHPEWAFRGLLILGVAELIFAFVARRRWRGAFVLLASIASMLLVAAIPFRYSGANWSLLWLLEAETLFVAGIAMREVVFRRLGMLAGFAVTIQLAVTGLAPLFDLRQNGVDASRHPALTIVLLTGAVLFWFNAEFAPRQWSFVSEDEIDRGLLNIVSYSGSAMAAAGLWVCVPEAWTVIAWLAVALALGLVADKLNSEDLAMQSDLLAAGVVARTIVVNFFVSGRCGPLTLRAVTVGVVCAMLYAAMRRRTRAVEHAPDYIGTLYSWVAGALLAALLWREIPYIGVAVAWTIFGVVLFELGKLLKVRYLREQSYALMALSFARIFIANLDFTNFGVTAATHITRTQMISVLPLIVAYYWLYERLERETDATPMDRIVRGFAGWFGTIAAGSLLSLEVRMEWVGIAWAAMASVLLLTGWLLKRNLFLAQSLVVLALTLLHAGVFDLFLTQPAGTPFILTRVFIVGSMCALMLLTLPVAFAVRRRLLGTAFNGDWQSFALSRPEQPYFFSPLLLLVVLLALELHAGMITVGWSALGVVTFLFALAVGERSYRLAGLAVLMLGMGKILVIDIWNASTSDRWFTLIAMGAALLLVSFLYSRYRETLLKFL